MRMKKKGYAKGGKLKMVEKDGKKVPFYAADGKGKMKAGGSVKSVRKPKRVKKKAFGGILTEAAKGMTKATASGDTKKMASALKEGLLSLSPMAALASGSMPKTGIMGMAYESVTGDDGKDSGKKLTAAQRRDLERQKAKKPTGMKKGGSVKKKMGGGSMKKKGYAKGGMVCRGMGAATRGGKFSVK